MNIHTELMGEARVVHQAADGTVLQDTGFQKNVILNQGLEAIGLGVNNYLMDSCVIGSGNTTPQYTDTTLNAVVAGVNSDRNNDVISSSYIPDSSNLYKINRIFKFVFTGLNNENISELGLASRYTGLSDYNLCTRMLVKDVNGNPTTITVLTGETLTVYYKLWMVFSTLDLSYVVNLSDGKGGLEPFNVVTRLADAGSSDYGGGNTVVVGSTLRTATITLRVSEYNITDITSKPTSESNRVGTASYYAYVPGSYKRSLYGSFGTTVGNVTIKSMHVKTALGIFQFGISKVSDGSFMTKTSQDTFAVSIELSWGRYEGVL